ncbi:ArsR/SmtB family transcription factor [[Clostridium] dakarense]|uniref:ArsR/SmtB family transcription factor n=1 Tax=Faecalimicrobium dakarense TaxID=1301100 RepID=UPI0004ADEE35|nr:helix-turn-helix domain-containing protein [[Clostridium] dakarense]
MKEVLVLRDLECIKAIAHPRRIDILKTFDKSPLSAKQLSQLLDEPHAKINYHIKTLYKVGILELVEEKIKSGIVEKYYYPKAKHIVIGKSVIDFSLDDECECDREELYISKFENISELFYQAAEEDTLEKNNIIDYNTVYLNREEIDEINETIKAKLKEILSKRESISEEAAYDLVILAVPLSKEEEYNI